MSSSTDKYKNGIASLLHKHLAFPVQSQSYAGEFWQGQKSLAAGKM